MDNNSGLNTGLLIAIVLILVAAAVWYFTSRQAQPESATEIEVTLPAGNNESE